MATKAKKKGTKGKGTKRVRQNAQTYNAPFDTSEAAVAERQARREERLKLLAPVGIEDANWITKVSLPKVVAAAAKAAQGKASKSERRALKAVAERLRTNSLRLTEKAKAEVRPFALAEAIETALNAA